MQKAVAWWCNIIGVTDPAAIDVATGIVAGGALILVVVWISTFSPPPQRMPRARANQRLTCDETRRIAANIAKLPELLQPTDYHSDQCGTILDQFLSSHGKDIELGTANHETEILEEATDLVLEISLDLDQKRPAHQAATDSPPLQR